MDHLSVISLSSSSSRASPRADSVSSVVSLSSGSQRVPVSWDDATDAQKAKDSMNNLQKVKEWMKSCSENRTTCIRYDFDKSPSRASLPASCYTRTTPLPSYMEEAKKSCGALNGRCRNNGSCDKKKELCSYLKLMKPEAQKKSLSPDNRRSTRGKSQTIGRKDVARKINFEEFEKVVTDVVKVVNDVVNHPSIKSLHDLNTKFDKAQDFLKIKNKYLPLPENRAHEEFSDFEDSIQDIIAEVNSTKKNEPKNGSLKHVEKRQKIKFTLKKPKFKKGHHRRAKSLRSRGTFRDISLDTLILRKSHSRKKAIQRRILKKKTQETEHIKTQETQEPIKPESPRCEIITVPICSDDENNIDLKNFVDDMLELDKMSAEHRKNIIESRILASSSITNLINKQTNKEDDVQRAIKIFSDLSNEMKNSEEKENTQSDTNTCKETNSLVPNPIISEHDYAMSPDHIHTDNDLEEESDEETDKSMDKLSPVPMPDLEILPVSTNIEIKSLHRSLSITTKPKLYSNYGLHAWNSKSDTKKLNHSITISQKNGPILKVFYHDCHLVIAQQNLVSFWTQSALGQILGAQNMWVPNGECQRILLNNTYRQKDALEMVVSMETSVAYVELWTKEHKSDVREVPVADVFATVYFWRLRQSGLDKKVLQLENIKGFTDDVQYCVLRCYPRIIVSWHSVKGGEKTKIHSYHLAADFQTVASISEIQPVEHYVSSLHTIEDCDNLVMGCGENKITLWNVEYGYIVATIELSNIKSPLSTLWVKCDRGFLFTIQECVDQELRLIAINGMNHSWKKLQNYSPHAGFTDLKGVCIEHGVLFAYYSQGILCWNAQSGELIVEEVANECEYIPSGKHVIIIINDKIIVRHSLSHLVTGDEF